ncbi:SNF2 family N-terminal domain-containing protein [Mycena rosella]|uniref:SNF2 family N-terminal domain-containing protein n=1 Tax=Mycena rosella TaxID=1033263 RepID=A0AAD7GR75_MYCRO|nr:SNF2 family N-terminal domain-containing protein [Mycena rosella]
MGVPLAAPTSHADESKADEEVQENEEEAEEDEDEEDATRYKQLERVLEKSAMYSALLSAQMAGAKARHVELLRARRVEAQAQANAKAKKGRPAKRRKGARGRVVVEDEVEDEAGGEMGVEEDAEGAFPQPALVTGARLKDYQLEGLQWMVSLHENGISGILADEMGLGKTLQTIAFSAHLRELRFSRPFLIVCPLSVLHNWADEYAKFAPGIPVVIYHGTPVERAALRRGPLALPPKIKIRIQSPDAAASLPPPPAAATGAAGRGRGNGKAKAAPAPAKGRGRGRAPPKEEEAPQESKQGLKRKRASAAASTSRAGASTSASRAAQNDEENGEDEDDDDSWQHGREGVAWTWGYPDLPDFPVVLTTYELIIRDRPVLGGYPWGYIVVDEGHRLKNMRCALVREITRYASAGRMVLTGTPLHNNLAELWSLLNFVLPDIFNDADAFQEWFSLPRMSTLLPSARMGTLISSLHAILKPFLLRRMKVDVLGSALPPKKSYVLYARLSAAQRTAYEAILTGGARGWLAATAGAASAPAPASGSTPASASASTSDTADAEDGRARRARRKAKGKGNARERERDEAEEEAERLRAAEAFRVKGAAKHVNNMKLQNTVMQLRKVCSHPFLFARPDDDAAPVAPAVLAAREAELLGASGKMLLLDRLLGELFRRGHKVLLFSQFTTMLDIIEDWAVDMKGWTICRIDGTTAPLERRDQMNTFQGAGDAPDAPRLFLLSTRAGGLGVNLTAADTVIFYDQDWNPQMDAQAQDRAHRIGQTRPVLIFRLVSAHTIEEKIMQRATEKRKLEALVIAKGKFKMPAAAAPAGKRATMAEMAADLLRLEGEQIDVLPADAGAAGGGGADVLSDADLEALLDRSAAVFADRGTGWRSAADKAAFAVFEPPVDGADDALAGMMGEGDGLEE